MTLPKIIFNVLAFVVLMAGCKAVHNNSDLNDERNKTKRAAKNAEAVTDGDSEEAGVNVDTAKTLDLKLGRDLLTAFKSYTRNPAQTEVSIDRVTGTYSVGRSGSKEKISCNREGCKIVLSAPVFQGDRNQVAGILAIGASGASVTGTVGGAYGKVFKDVKPNSMLRIYGDVKQGATIVCAELNPGNEYGCVFSPRKS